jgi:hypothetical protein
VNFISSAKGIPTSMVDYTMGWFEDGMCLHENIVQAVNFVCSAKGIPTLKVIYTMG